MYSFLPSKSWALYFFVASVLRWFSGFGHVELATLITLLYLLMVLTTFAIGRRLVGRQRAAIATAIIALSAPFMELNYLEPEYFVFLLGLAAAYALARHPTITTRDAVVAGLSIGIGCAFKMVAGFYVAGAIAYILLHPRPKQLRGRVWTVVLVLSAFVAALAGPGLYFAATGRLHEHIEWTFTFPLFWYPRNTYFIRTLYTKLLWFLLLLSLTVAISLTNRLRRCVYGDGPTRVMLCFGVGAAIALMKTQPSHYMFPSAGMLAFYIAAVWVDWWRLTDFRRYAGRLTVAVAVAGLTCGACVAQYRPQVLSRVFEMRDYKDEALVAMQCHQYLGDPRALAFFPNSRLLYWLTHRYPPVNFIDSEVQTTHYLRTDRTVFMRALRNPRLVLVAFDPDHPAFDDPLLLTDHNNEPWVSQFCLDLRVYFEERGRGDRYRLWVRRDTTATTAAAGSRRASTRPGVALVTIVKSRPSSE